MLLFVILSFVFGSVLGSFLGVVSDRLPVEKKLSGRSKCESCGKKIGALGLVPVFSFLFQRGKCLDCGARIPRHLFWFEVLTGFLFSVLAVNGGLLSGLDTVVLFVLGCTVLALSLVVFWVDLKHFLILDAALLPSGLIALIGRGILDWNKFGGFSSQWSVLVCIICAAAFFSLFGGLHYLSKGKWFGFGDVKLLLVLALFFGLKAFLVLWLASVLASLWSVYLIMRKRATMKTKLPFGSFLAIAAVVILFYGSGLSEVYLNIF
jgi:prepilin signal peptidase PulO-like enzyme (type II secretory pathway)